MKRKEFDSLKDDEIISIIKSEGATRYFDILYKRYHQKVYNKCYSFVKSKQVAEELAEEIFAKSFEHIQTFKQLSSFSSWLYTVTYNHCIDFLREKKKLHYPKWNSEHEIPEIIDEQSDELNDINYDNLLLILEQIHPEEKALLLMKYQDNLSLKSISTALRISEDAAKMRLKRARTRVIYLYTNKYLKNN